MLSWNVSKALQMMTFTLKRNISIRAPRLNSAINPIEQLFNEKLQEYHSKSSGGKMVDPTPEILKELDSELVRIGQKYGCENDEELKKFPKFKFDEPIIDPIMETMP